ncbi:MAG TPA: hypothetical protein PLV25_02645, partial [Opitutales bacterium]|nr:hypothetical protein [Opitutales bacterium]
MHCTLFLNDCYGAARIVMDSKSTHWAPGSLKRLLRKEVLSIYSYIMAGHIKESKQSSRKHSSGQRAKLAKKVAAFPSKKGSLTPKLAKVASDSNCDHPNIIKYFGLWSDMKED